MYRNSLAFPSRTLAVLVFVVPVMSAQRSVCGWPSTPRQFSNAPASGGIQWGSDMSPDSNAPGITRLARYVADLSSQSALIVWPPGRMYVPVLDPRRTARLCQRLQMYPNQSGGPLYFTRGTDHLNTSVWVGNYEPDSL